MLRKKAFDAVIKAHKDAARMGRIPEMNEIVEYLSKRVKANATVKGIYRKWIISEALVKGKHIFGCIRESDFVNI